MRGSIIPARAIISALALAASACAAILPTPASLDKRMLYAPGGSRVTFQGLENNQFWYDPSSRQTPATGNALFSEYGDAHFHDGKPLYFLRSEDSKMNVNRLRRAVYDFGGFHARVVGQARTVSFVPAGHDGTYQSLRNEPGLVGRLNQIDHMRGIFGENAARLAYGFNAYTATSSSRTFLGLRRGQSTKSFADIHKLPALDGGAAHEVLRNKLNQDRALRFTNDDHSLSLALRAHPDGSIEHQLINSATKQQIFRWTQYVHLP